MKNLLVCLLLLSITSCSIDEIKGVIFGKEGLTITPFNDDNKILHDNLTTKNGLEWYQGKPFSGVSFEPCKNNPDIHLSEVKFENGLAIEARGFSCENERCTAILKAKIVNNKSVRVSQKTFLMDGTIMDHENWDENEKLHGFNKKSVYYSKSNIRNGIVTSYTQIRTKPEDIPEDAKFLIKECEYSHGELIPNSTKTYFDGDKVSNDYDPWVSYYKIKQNTTVEHKEQTNEDASISAKPRINKPKQKTEVKQKTQGKQKKVDRKNLWVINDPDGYTNVRSDKSSKSRILFVLYENQKFEVLNNNGKWWRIKYDNMVGYIHNSRVKKAN